MAVGFSRDMWYNYIADRSHPPVASAVVEIPEWDPDHVYAWKPADNYKGWKLIARGEAGVDDAAVIQAAIDTVYNNGGGLIKLRKGTFLIDSQISIPDKIYLVGEGMYSTILRANTDLPSLILIQKIEEYFEGILLADMMIHMNHNAGDGVIVDGTGRSVFIERCRVSYASQNGYAGIRIKNLSWGVVIKDCHLDYNFYGIVNEDSNFMRVNETIVRFSYYHGIYVLGGNSTRIFHSVIEKSQNQWACHIRLSGGSDHEIIDNHLEDAPEDGKNIHIGETDTSVDNCLVLGNTMTENNHNIYLQNAQNTLIGYNRIGGIGRSIFITSACSGTVILPNNIEETTGGIYDAGTNTIKLYNKKFGALTSYVFELLSSPPTSPAVGEVYLDDGTNTADGNPHLRMWDGSTWVDL